MPLKPSAENLGLTSAQIRELLQAAYEDGRLDVSVIKRMGSALEGQA